MPEGTHNAETEAQNTNFEVITDEEGQFFVKNTVTEEISGPYKPWRLEPELWDSPRVRKNLKKVSGITAQTGKSDEDHTGGAVFIQKAPGQPFENVMPPEAVNGCDAGIMRSTDGKDLICMVYVETNAKRKTRRIVEFKIPLFEDGRKTRIVSGKRHVKHLEKKPI